MLRATPTALAPASGLAARAHAGRPGARVAVANPAARLGSLPTFKTTMVPSALRATIESPAVSSPRSTRPSRSRISPSASSAAAPAPAPEDDDAPSAPPLYPHLELDFRPILSVPALLSCVCLSWAAVVAYAVLFVKFHLIHHTLNRAGLYFHVGCFAVVGAAAFWIARAFVSERQEQARLVDADKAADDDSLFADVDGVRVHYKRRRGSALAAGSNPTAVVSCVHGFGANTYSFERAAMQPLADALDASIVAHDSPGFGLTERPAALARYTPRNNADITRAMLDIAECEPSGETNDSDEDDETRGKTWSDVVAEMTKEGEEGEEGGDATNLSATTTNHSSSRPRRVVVGHSMGGVAAAIAAAKGDVDDVVLVAPAVIAAGGSVPNAATTNTANPLAAVLGSFARVFRVTLAYLASPVLMFAVRKLVRSAAFWRDGLSKAVGRAAASAMRGDATWADGYRRPSAVRGWDVGMIRVVLSAATGGVNGLAALFADPADAEANAPESVIAALSISGARVLIVHGDEDAIVPLGNSVMLRESIPGAELAVMEGVGHMPHEEAPAKFVEKVARFVRAGRDARRDGRSA